MKTFGVAWVAAFNAMILGMAISDMGDIPTCSSEPYGWTLIFAVLGFIVVPSLFAFFLGIQAARDKQ